MGVNLLILHPPLVLIFGASKEGLASLAGAGRLSQRIKPAPV
jgi:hypothetical protein